MGPRRPDGAPRSLGAGAASRSRASSIARQDTTHYLLAVGLFEHAPDRVSVYELSPRDGLQNERATVPLRGKLRLIDALVQAGLKRIEIASFVSPKWIPQLADADEVAEHAKPPPGVTFSALCPNPRGLDRARAAGMKEIAVFLSSSETHNKKNVNKTIDQTLAAFEETVG